ncbi:uncharacterized protein BDV14DRAFT_208713 [Aspergillus stella-maris]|uniref:uncharacterized protein n=1 Tax=Aspergillus stella-maris TaxID=1810926 RepID=UPI003CCD6F57
MVARLSTLWLQSYIIASAVALTFYVPASPPDNSSPQLSSAPVGVSLEFFTFPAYFNDVAATTTCLANFRDLTGVWPPLRIGGTTQDRATYNPTSTEAVTYSVDDPDDAPLTLTYGPLFISQAAEYEGTVTLGLNRRLNNIENTISAASLAVDEIGNLLAIELGNEPNFFTDDDPIADGSAWTAEADYASQISWQDAVAGNLSASSIFSAGVYFGTDPMSIQDLASQEVDAGTNDLVRDYSSHNYPQYSPNYDLAALMSHSGIASQVEPFRAEVVAANEADKPHVFGETNSATQGGGGISPTFGAALWIVDYVMQLVTMGTEAIYFHQGTIGNCQYCWWGRYTTGAPYYGAYFATLALANADYIAPLDDQSTAYAAYAIYEGGVPVKVLLYNSDYYTSGTRGSQTYTLTGLSSSSVTARRLTAAYSTSRVDEGETPTVAGQTFGNGDCTVQGDELIETLSVTGGEATLTVSASEALLVTITKRRYHINSNTEAKIMKLTEEEQQTINALQKAWIWPPNWTDPAPENVNTAGRVVHFTRAFSLPSKLIRALLHISADTRYKLFVNGLRVAVGPTKGSPAIWYYDTLDIAGYLKEGKNVINIDVVRYFNAVRGAMPFQRTAVPGVTVVGCVELDGGEVVEIGTERTEDWRAQVDEAIQFPVGLVDDPFLHINERISPTAQSKTITPVAYGIKTVNGELAPWRLRPRPIPMYEESNVRVHTVRSCKSALSSTEWTSALSKRNPLTLDANSTHTLELQADVHSTAFLRWSFQASKPSFIKLKITYSEGYELDPRAYPFFRTKADRLDAENGHLIGPFDEVHFDVSDTKPLIYEPFWFRTFRLLRLEITVGTEPVLFHGLKATQVNYPLNTKASFSNPSDADTSAIWDVSIRTLRNCMFDSYADCPFYEQLQYSGDSRSVGLFHYLLSGDDRLMRQAIVNYAASITPEGLTQSRFPSHVPQVIAGFSLYWVLQVADHFLYFGDISFTRGFLPRVDGVLEFFNAYIDELGLVSGLPEDVWQYVDWVTSWGATDDHPDKGVPTAGRKSNRHTYFSLLYVYVLQRAAELVRDVGRPGYAEEYLSRAESVQDAVRKHCYDGSFFTDSTVNQSGQDGYSQHAQVFAIISGTAYPEDRARLLSESFSNPRFSKASYMMRFYAFRAFSLAGDEIYESFWKTAWDPYRKMLAQNLSTWEEDDVRQRSDCHAWGSVPVYEYCVELAGVQPVSAGCKRILFKPRLGLSEGIKATVALGRDNVADVEWSTREDGRKEIVLRLEKCVEVVSRLPLGEEVEQGVVGSLSLMYP